MGSIPTKCGEVFEVSSSGATKEEAVQNAQNKADDLCKRLKQGCDQAHEVSKGSFKGDPGLITYTSKYSCIGI